MSLPFAYKASDIFSFVLLLPMLDFFLKKALGIAGAGVVAIPRLSL